MSHLPKIISLDPGIELQCIKSPRLIPAPANNQHHQWVGLPGQPLAVLSPQVWFPPLPPFFPDGWAPTLKENSSLTRNGKLTACRMRFSFRVCSICFSFTTCGPGGGWRGGGDVRRLSHHHPHRRSRGARAELVPMSIWNLWS